MHILKHISFSRSNGATESCDRDRMIFLRSGTNDAEKGREGSRNNKMEDSSGKYDLKREKCIRNPAKEKLDQSTRKH